MDLKEYVLRNGQVKVKLCTVEMTRDDESLVVDAESGVDWYNEVL